MKTTRTISHNEAHEIAQRFIDRHFGNRDKANNAEIMPRIHIPADPDRDDDLLISAYIDQQQARETRLLEVAEALWQLLDDIDTLSDSMHPDLSPYLTAVQARVTRRFEHFKSDGLELTLTEKSP